MPKRVQNSSKPESTRQAMRESAENYWTGIKITQVMHLMDSVTKGELTTAIIKELGEVEDTLKRGERLSGEQRWIVNRLSLLLAKHIA